MLWDVSATFHGFSAEFVKCQVLRPLHLLNQECIYLFSITMGRFMKPGKVVLVLGGRYAGRKAVIVKVSLLV